MGAAETRALWQRMASRCCVQEDLKRAPKLACCQQELSVASAKFVDLEPSADLSSGSFEDTSYCSEFSADKKWWLKGSTDQLFSSLEEELEILNPGLMNSHLEDIKCKKMHEFVDLMETREEYASKKTSIAGQLNEMYFEPLKSPWVPSKKSAPWWRTATDKDELALLVATKSLENIQNCDLPQPQTVHKRIHRLSDNTKRPGSLSSSPIQETGFQESAKTSWQRGVWDMDHGVEKSRSGSSTCSKNTSPKSPGNDLNKAQLLEALCHSQTRAREAEEATRKAYTEKEHIITILFRQASQLFAYEQWFQLVQLEGLYLQMKNKEKRVTGRNVRKRWQRSKKGEIGRYVVAFALGFSLIGAGLLLGWTVGWLLPF